MNLIANALYCSVLISAVLWALFLIIGCAVAGPRSGGSLSY